LLVLFLWRRFLVLFIWRRSLVLFLVTTRLAPLVASWTRWRRRRFLWRRFFLRYLFIADGSATRRRLRGIGHGRRRRSISSYSLLSLRRRSISSSSLLSRRRRSISSSSLLSRRRCRRGSRSRG
jgi:hypothetical protein